MGTGVALGLGLGTGLVLVRVRVQVRVRVRVRVRVAAMLAAHGVELPIERWGVAPLACRHVRRQRGVRRGASAAACLSAPRVITPAAAAAKAGAVLAEAVGEAGNAALTASSAVAVARATPCRDATRRLAAAAWLRRRLAISERRHRLGGRRVAACEAREAASRAGQLARLELPTR